MKHTNVESLKAWEDNAEFWDDYMGDESNFFHCDLVRPHTEELLDAPPLLYLSQWGVFKISEL